MGSAVLPNASGANGGAFAAGASPGRALAEVALRTPIPSARHHLAQPPTSPLHPVAAAALLVHQGPAAWQGAPEGARTPGPRDRPQSDVRNRRDVSAISRSWWCTSLWSCFWAAVFSFDRCVDSSW